LCLAKTTFDWKRRLAHGFAGQILGATLDWEGLIDDRWRDSCYVTCPQAHLTSDQLLQDSLKTHEALTHAARS
jgi:hypothetical protein